MKQRNEMNRKRRLLIDTAGAAAWTAAGLAYLTAVGIPYGWGVVALPLAGAATAMLFDTVRKSYLRAETRPVGTRMIGTMIGAVLLAVIPTMWAQLGPVSISVALFGGALGGFLAALGVFLLVGAF